MAKKEKTELPNRSTEDLLKREQELYDQVFKLRFQVATGQTENPGRIRLARRDLARIKTALSERRNSDRVASAGAAKGSK